VSKNGGVEMKNVKEIAVLVTTEFRGVFFGYVADLKEVGRDTITLHRAQNCVYWSADVRGFMGLASTGPTTSCKIGPAVSSIVLAKVTAVVEVTDEAAEKWMKAPWNG
jgi:hypothetical protein